MCLNGIGDIGFRSFVSCRYLNAPYRRGRHRLYTYRSLLGLAPFLTPSRETSFEDAGHNARNARPQAAGGLLRLGQYGLILNNEDTEIQRRGRALIYHYKEAFRDILIVHG
jgi:hypothetical protein